MRFCNLEIVINLIKIIILNIHHASTIEMIISYVNSYFSIINPVFPVLSRITLAPYECNKLGLKGEDCK